MQSCPGSNEDVWKVSDYVAPCVGSDYCHRRTAGGQYGLWPLHPGSTERKDPWLLNAEPAKDPICAFGINSLSSNGRAITESQVILRPPPTPLHPTPPSLSDFVLLYPQEMLTKTKKNTRPRGWVTAEMVKGCWERELNLALLRFVLFYIMKILRKLDNFKKILPTSRDSLWITHVLTFYVWSHVFMPPSIIP